MDRTFASPSGVCPPKSLTLDIYLIYGTLLYMNRDSIIFFAGIFDGEGSLMIEIQSKNAVRKYDYFSLRLVITNTNKELIDWMATNFGGKISTRKKIVGRKTTYDWKLYSLKAANLIRQALPFFIVKRERSKIFLTFSETIGKTGWNIPKELRDYRQELYEQMKILNKQGT